MNIHQEFVYFQESTKTRFYKSPLYTLAVKAKNKFPWKPFDFYMKIKNATVLQSPIQLITAQCFTFTPITSTLFYTLPKILHCWLGYTHIYYISQVLCRYALLCNNIVIHNYRVFLNIYPSYYPECVFIILKLILWLCIISNNKPKRLEFLKKSGFIW